MSQNPLEHGIPKQRYPAGDPARPVNPAFKNFKRHLAAMASSDGASRSILLGELAQLSSKGMLAAGPTAAASLVQISAFGSLDSALTKLMSNKAVILESVGELLETFLRKVPSERVIGTSWTVDMTRWMYRFVSQKLQAVKNWTSLRRFESIRPQDFLSDDSINLADPAASGIRAPATQARRQEEYKLAGTVEQDVTTAMAAAEANATAKPYEDLESDMEVATATEVDASVASSSAENPAKRLRKAAMDRIMKDQESSRPTVESLDVRSKNREYGNETT